MTSEVLKPDCYKNPYIVSRLERAALVSELLISRPPFGNQKTVCYKFDGDSKFSNIGRSIESEVFGKSFVGNDPDRMLEEYGPYEDNSIFFITIDTENQEASGTLRVIENSTDGPDGFKTLDDLDEGRRNAFAGAYGIDDFSSVWDVGTLAVLRNYRSRDASVSSALYLGMYTEAQSRGVNHLVSVIDERVYSKLREYIGIPFEPLLDMSPEDYIGTPSQFVYGRVDKFEESVRKKRRQRFYVPAIRRAIGSLTNEKPGTLQF